MVCQNVFKRSPLGTISATWAATYFSRDNLCRHFFPKGYLLRDVANTRDEKMFFNGFLLGDVYVTWYETSFCRGFLLGAIVSTWADTTFARGYFLGPYLPHGLKKFMQVVPHWCCSYHKGRHIFCKGLPLLK